MQLPAPAGHEHRITLLASSSGVGPSSFVTSGLSSSMTSVGTWTMSLDAFDGRADEVAERDRHRCRLDSTATGPRGARHTSPEHEDFRRSAANLAAPNAVLSLRWQLRHVRLRAAGHGGGDPAADELGGSLQRIGSQMAVPCRRLRLAMPEQGADQWQAHAAGDRDRGEAVPQVVQPARRRAAPPCAPVATVPRGRPVARRACLHR